MKNVIEGKLNAKGFKIAVIGARFNDLITTRLIDGAKDCFMRHDGKEIDFTLFYVPGAYEIPVLAKKIVSLDKFDAVVCVGAVIRGATPHFDFVASEAAKGIAQVSINSQVPVIFSILTTDTIEQAIERAGTKAGNKGWDGMLAAIEMVNLFKEIEKI